MSGAGDEWSTSTKRHPRRPARPAANPLHPFLFPLVPFFLLLVSSLVATSLPCSFEAPDDSTDDGVTMASKMAAVLRKLETDNEPGLTAAQLMLTNHDLKPGVYWPPLASVAVAGSATKVPG